MSFCTAINCMDGRVQLPAIEYLKKRLGVSYVDTITEPGPARILADGAPLDTVNSILSRIDISVQKHKSACIAVIAHHDCAGNPVDKKTQLDQLRKAARFLIEKYPDIDIIALWLDSNWLVSQAD